jgi:hypothetical protein
VHRRYGKENAIDLAREQRAFTVRRDALAG